MALLAGVAPSAAQAFTFTGTDYATQNQARELAVGDFNEDGWQDLAVANIASNSVSILLGVGGAQFTAATSYPVGGDFPTTVVVGDFDGDDNQDLAVTNYTSGDISVLLGNGDGRFGAAAQFNAGPQPFGIATRDLDHDGDLDLVASLGNSGGASHLPGYLAVLLGDGAGGFGSPTTFPCGDFPQDLDVGYFDDDDNIDVVVANYRLSTVSIFLGNGDGTFQNQTEVLAGPAPIGVAVGDIDNDSDSDIVTANYNLGDPSGPGDVAVLLGDGEGHFVRQTPNLSGEDVAVGPSAVALSDFNGDARLDLAVLDQWAAEGGLDRENSDVYVLIGKGDGTFTPYGESEVGQNPEGLAQGDFNLDGRPDLAATSNWWNAGGKDVTVLRNSGPEARTASGGAASCPGGFDAFSGPFTSISAQSYAGGVGYKADTTAGGHSALGRFTLDGDPPTGCDNPATSSRPELGFTAGHSVAYGGAFRFGVSDFWSRVTTGNVVALDFTNPSLPGWGGRFALTSDHRVRFSTYDGTTTQQILIDPSTGALGMPMPVDNCWHTFQVWQKLGSSWTTAQNVVWIDGVVKAWSMAPNYPQGTTVPYNTIRAGIVSRSSTAAPGPIVYADEVGIYDPLTSPPAFAPPPC